MELHEDFNPELFSREIAPELMKLKPAFVFNFIAENRSKLFTEEDHQGIFNNAKKGRTNIAPERLSCVLLLEYFCNVSDVQAMNCLTYDIRWKNALGLDLESPAPFDRTTLVKYRSRLIKLGKLDIVFKRSIELCAEAGLISKAEMGRFQIDSTSILGAGAVKDTFNLFADGIKHVLRGVRDLLRLNTLQEAAMELGLSYDPNKSIKGQLDLDWTDPVAGRAALNEILDMVCELESAVDKRNLRDSLGKQFAFIDAIIEQDVEDDPINEGSQIKTGTAKDRIVSSSDQEMRHGRKSARKRFDGYKSHAVTCGDSGVVTGITVVPGNEPDGKGMMDAILQAEENLDAKSTEILADCAYNTTENLDKLNADPNRNPDQLITKPRRHSNKTLFTKDNFKIDVDQQTITCPANVTLQLPSHPSYSNLKAGLGYSSVIQSPKSSCHTCWQRHDCIRQNAASGRSVSIHKYEKHQQNIRQLARVEEGRSFLRKRVAVEHVLARLVRRGLRKARYMGKNKVLFQAKWIAAAVNIRLLASKIGK